LRTAKICNSVNVSLQAQTDTVYICDYVVPEKFIVNIIETLFSMVGGTLDYGSSLSSSTNDYNFVVIDGPNAFFSFEDVEILFSKNMGNLIYLFEGKVTLFNSSIVDATQFWVSSLVNIHRANNKTWEINISMNIQNSLFKSSVATSALVCFSSSSTADSTLNVYLEICSFINNTIEVTKTNELTKKMGGLLYVASDNSIEGINLFCFFYQYYYLCYLLFWLIIKI
jgi:hypothetical protein